MVIGANGGAGRGTPEKRCRCVVNALARARRRRFRTCRRCRTCRSAALLVGTERYRRPAAVAAAAERADALPLLRMSAWSEWFWMPEGAMLLISMWAGKPCSPSSQMWLSAAPGGVIGGDAVCIVVNWIWCRPPCECWRSSFPSASASTRRRRLMPLGWRSGEK